MATAEAQIDDMLRRERLLATLGAAFAGLALLLVAIGLQDAERCRGADQ
jgi:hypothetical protein